MTIQEEIKRNIKSIIDSDSEINKKAIELMKIGELICDQFNVTEYRKAFEEFSDELKEKIEAVTITLEKEINQNSHLLSQEEEINKKYALLQEKNILLQELNKKKTALEATLDINDDIKNLNVLNDDLVKNIIENLQKLNEVLPNAISTTEKELLTIKNEAIKNLSLVQNNQIDLLNKLDITPLTTKFEEFDVEVNKLREDYNDRVEKIKTIKADLEEISTKHDEVIEAFNKHQLSNDEIFGKLKNRDGVLEYVQKLSEDIRTGLDKYDSQIKSLIIERDKIPDFK